MRDVGEVATRHLGRRRIRIDLGDGIGDDLSDDLRDLLDGLDVAAGIDRGVRRGSDGVSRNSWRPSRA